MLVVDGGAGDISPGDLLISSDVRGCAMKHDADRFPIGHIIARAAQSVNWSAVHPDASGIRGARVSVLFESFVRDSLGPASMTLREAEFAELRARNEELEDRLARLEHQLADRLASSR